MKLIYYNFLEILDLIYLFFDLFLELICHLSNIIFRIFFYVIYYLLSILDSDRFEIQNVYQNFYFYVFKILFIKNFLPDIGFEPKYHYLCFSP